MFLMIVKSENLTRQRDFANKFPSAKAYAPPNCRFELDNAELDWTFAPASFDFIHMRYLMGAIGNWPGLYDQAYK